MRLSIFVVQTERRTSASEPCTEPVEVALKGTDSEPCLPDTSIPIPLRLAFFLVPDPPVATYQNTFITLLSATAKTSSSSLGDRI